VTSNLLLLFINNVFFPCTYSSVFILLQRNNNVLFMLLSVKMFQKVVFIVSVLIFSVDFTTICALQDYFLPEKIRVFFLWNQTCQ